MRKLPGDGHLRIAHVLETLEIGGAETLVASLCRSQREAGHEPSVFCLYRAGEIAERLRRERFQVQLIEGRSRLEKIRGLQRAFRACAADAIHFHNAEATILGAAPARWVGVRQTVSTRHGLVSPPYAWKQELQYAAAGLMVRHIVAVCRQAEGNLRGIPLLPGRRIRTIYNGCAPPQRTGAGNLFSPEAEWRVVQVGRLQPPKDPGCLIEAAALARKTIAGLQVVFLGDGQMRPEMEALARQLGLQDCVRFAGPQANIGDWLDQADQLVLCSRSEGVPIAILEALEAGLPVAAADVGGIRDVLPGGDLAALIPAGDHHALAGAICSEWGRRGSREARKEAIRAHFLRSFTIEKMASEYEHLYLS